MSDQGRSHRSPIILTGISFLVFAALGLPDGLLGVAWPSIRTSFGVPLESLGLLLLTFTLGYLVSSFFSGRLLRQFSFDRLLVAGTLAMVASLIAYTFSLYWWLLVAISGIGGLGAGAVDAAMNTYAATNYSARTVNWLHGSFGIGATVGPAIMTGILLAGWRWQWGYGLVAGGQSLIAVGIALTRARWRVSSPTPDLTKDVEPASTISTLRLPGVWLSIAVFTVYTGIEVSAGQWTFTLITEGRSLSTGAAGTWVSIYWGALALSRFGLGMLAGVVPVYKLLRYCIVVAILAAGSFG